MKHTPSEAEKKAVLDAVFAPLEEVADPLVSELRNLATTECPLCPEARLLLEMAVDAQQGKPIDTARLLQNNFR